MIKLQQVTAPSAFASSPTSTVVIVDAARAQPLQGPGKPAL